MTGMMSLGICLEAEKCFTSSSKISKGNEKTVAYLPFIKLQAGDKREWKNP
jgi:hypothetical protein